MEKEVENKVENTPEKKEEKKKSKVGLIIALIIAGSLIFISLIVLLVVFFLKGTFNQPKPVVIPKPAVEEITITFDADGGLEVEKIKFDKGTTVELPESTKDGFAFGGWFDGEKQYKTEDTATLEKDITLKAKWEELKSTETLMTINFNTNGGNKMSSVQVKCINNSTEIKNLPTPKKDGYNFMSWADKNGTPILNGAMLICNDTLNLYANWEEIKNTKPVEKEKTYKCPEGYELKDTNKCVKLTSANVESYCEGNWKLVNGDCVNPSVDTKTREGNRTCPEKTINGWTGTGYLYNQGRDYCAYYEMPSYTGANQQCANAGGRIIPGNSYKCFKYTGYDYSMTCSEGTKYMEAQALGGGSNPGCYYVSTPKTKKTCPEGYSSYSVYGDCAIVKDATLE